MTEPPTEQPRHRPELRTMLTDPLGSTALRSLQLLIIVGLASLVVWASLQLTVVVIPVLIAIILACALTPVTDRLRQVMPPLAATALTMLLVVGVFGLVIYFIVLNVMSEFDELQQSVMGGITQLEQFIESLPFNITSEQLTDARNAVFTFLTSAGVGSSVIGGVTSVGSFITSAVLMVVILFFFLKDGRQIWKFLISPLRGHQYERGQRVGETGNRVLGGYIRGTATIALVDTIGITAGMLILGVPLAFPLAMIVFIGAFIPIVGATAAGFLACLVALVTQGPVVALILLAVIILVNQLEGNFLQPVVMAQTLSLHPLIVLVALTAGTVLGSIVGAVLAVPAAAVIWAIMKTWNDEGPVSRDSKRAEEQQARVKQKWARRFRNWTGRKDKSGESESSGSGAGSRQAAHVAEPQPAEDADATSTAHQDDSTERPGPDAAS